MARFYSLVLKSAMQKERWSPIHLERAIKGQRQRKGGMDKGLENKNKDAYE